MVQKIDAHSKDVARKHYLWNAPAKHAKLAKILVRTLPGKPAAWPDPSKVLAEGKAQEALQS
eukprot:12887778-Alexandrium_andersonii.AAC.1